MPILPFIYFLLLMFYFWRKNRTFDTATAITLFFVVSSLFAVLVDVYDLYSEYGINPKVVSLVGTFVYCGGITVVIYPFSKISISNIKTISLKKPVLLNWFCYIVFISFLLYVGYNYENIYSSFILDAADIKSMHYEELSSAAKKSQPIYMYLVNIIVTSWSLVLCIWFYSISFLKKGILFNTALLISSSAGILYGVTIAGRAALVYWVFAFFVFYSFFAPLMPNKVKRHIRILALVLGALILAFMATITISRFADGEDNGAWFSFIGYAGQMYNNFCVFFEYGRDLPITIERIMPITYKYILGGDFNLFDFYERIESTTGFYAACFYTLIGGLLINVGLIGMMIYLLVYYIIANWMIKGFNKNPDFSYLIIYSLLLLVPIKGMFDIPFTGISDTLYIFFSIFLFWLFKYTFKYK